MLWLHIDGAYGGLFVLSDRKRDTLEPCGLADSLAIDPHKLLFAPLEAGCVIMRNPDKLERAFRFSSPYLTVEDDPLMVDFMDYGPQLSRDFKALKIWSALHTFGVDAFRTTLDRTMSLAQYLGERIQAQPALELIAPVNLTAVCFRVVGVPEKTHRDLLARLAEEGTALLGPVTVDGHTGIRACIPNHRTTRDDIDLIVNRLTELTGPGLLPGGYHRRRPRRILPGRSTTGFAFS